MKAPLLVGTIALSVLLGGCAAQPAPAPQSQASSPSTTQPSAKPSASPQSTAIEIKFYDESGAEVTKDELSESVKLTTDKYINGASAMDGYFDQIEQMMNHFPSAKEVRNNLGYADDKELTKEDYVAASRIHRKAYDVLYKSPSGNLYNSINNYADHTAENRYDTRNEDEPYRVTFEPGAANYEMFYDNSSKNTADDLKAPIKLLVDGGALERSLGLNGKQPAWLIPGDANLKKQ